MCYGVGVAHQHGRLRFYIKAETQYRCKANLVKTHTVRLCLSTTFRLLGLKNSAAILDFSEQSELIELKLDPPKQ